jgi:hypothetical protein
MKIFAKEDTRSAPAMFTPATPVHFAVGFAAFGLLNNSLVHDDKFALWMMAAGAFGLRSIVYDQFPNACRKLRGRCTSSVAYLGVDFLVKIAGYAFARYLGKMAGNVWVSVAVLAAALVYTLTDMVPLPTERWDCY